MNDGEGRGQRSSLPSLSVGRQFWLRIASVGIFDALLISIIPVLYTNESWILLGSLLGALVLVNWAYLSRRAQASKWLTPGLIFMALFVVYPVIYTFYVSLTNWATGNVLTKEQAIERMESREIESGTETARLDLAVYRDGAGEIGFLVFSADSEPFFGRPRTSTEEPLEDSSIDTGGVIIDPAALPDILAGFSRLAPLQLTGIATQLEGLVLDLPGGLQAKLETFSVVRVLEAGRRFFYDPVTDTLFDAQEDRTCSIGIGTFNCDGVPESSVSGLALANSSLGIVCVDGLCDNVPLQELDQSLSGWRTVIGGENYTKIFTNDRIRQPFVGVFIWNFVFALSSVVLTFGLGLALANALQDERLKGRAVYRSLFILPYAIPAFLSVLVWRGLLNDNFGQVNRALTDVGLGAVPWLSDPTMAKVAVILVNLWLGFPYMFLITSGALTSIPSELKEAARVDGASPWKVFRSITLPLLLVSTAPLLIGSFAFNFNNFVLIFMLTNGGPPLSGFEVPVGATDILISFTFDIATRSGRGNQFALASAIVVLIFVIVAVLSAISFRWTKKLEETYGN